MKAYYAVVTESEAGWGQKHDGYLIALTKEDLKKKADSFYENQSYEIYWRADTPKLCILKDNVELKEGCNLVEDIKRLGCLWVDNNKSEWLEEE